MRDPNRIDGYCARLAGIWKKVPDWRFGQLVFNLLEAYSEETRCDAFYAEDDGFFAYLEKLTNEYEVPDGEDPV